jgi:putative ABC transport system ATP-binding protein
VRDVAIACREVTVEYSGGGQTVRPIERLSTEFGDGEVTLLLGASGSGKTTLLSTLAAILRPNSGEIEVQGTALSGLSGEALNRYRRYTVGIVFQSFNLVASLTAEQNVAVPLLAAGRGSRVARRRAQELLDDLGLAERRSHRPADMSGGQQQRVAVARALALDPPVVLADEPTAHLDYVQAGAIIALLRKIADEGRTVVVSTHDERLTPVADSILDMSPVGAEQVSFAKRVSLAAGETLFREGERGELAYVVEQGEIELFKITQDGREELVRSAGPGSYFGELAPVLKMPRTATARATQASVVLAMSGAELRRYVLRPVAGAAPNGDAGGPVDATG